MDIKQEQFAYTDNYGNTHSALECTHPISTVCSDDDIYAIICDDCGKQFTESAWTDYKEKEAKEFKDFKNEELYSNE